MNKKFFIFNVIQIDDIFLYIYYSMYIFMSDIKIRLEAEKTTATLVNKVYEKLNKNISLYKKVVNRPITIYEKILIVHLANYKDIESANDYLIPTKSYVLLKT